MMKRLLLAAILAIPTLGIANFAAPGDPYPGCYPCPPIPPASQSTAIVAPSDAR